MLESLKEMSYEICDCIHLLPSNKKGMMNLEYSKYKNPGEKLNMSEYGLGDMYHILIFKENANDEVCDLDLFEGILGDPLEYISSMIKMNWFGIVCKKTTTSTGYIQEVFDNIIGS
jgi:hypothetical protein